jgi:ATP-dependent Clp protease ATP-binding subunit ClpA
MEREAGTFDPSTFTLSGKARLTTLEIGMNPAALAKKPKKQTRALIFGDEENKDGAAELRRTSRSLNAMYPDDLDRAVGREREVEELARLFAATDRRPVLLVGPRKVGKTTILHELVRNICERKRDRYGGRREIWLVSPMRLISGMSYLGEWENRVLAIFQHAKSKDLVLYFDDLPGLFTAGVSAASDLNVAQVLRPWMEKRSIRVIAEITPEAWQALRERDRAFADLFQVIPVNEPPEPETLRVLINVARQLEETHRCAFDLEVVPAAYELHRRFATGAAFPGKAAAFLKRLAVRFAGSSVNRRQTLHEFHLQSGLQVAMLDDAPWERNVILDALRARVVGQDHALDAFADALLTLKARLNDPRRPLATMLLLGPTGVGKTQAAKTLAEFLFGSTERLLRFDMNEHADGASAARLTGSPREPEGLLTSAVRRQPFSVVLFDEIEKAAPEVFDLLLALVDEGRLTDALGRVTDFTQSVILLTSNLGTREARSRLGFGADNRPDADDAIYISAAEKFFRPEFFNRLDRIIPFRSLERTHLEGIARQLFGGLLVRDGLRRRNGLLNVTPQAMTRLVELGHHPQLGARALKRVIEREVAQPLAELLSSQPPGTPMIAHLAASADGFAVSLKDLIPVPRAVSWPEAVARTRTAAQNSAWTAKVLAGAYASLDRIEAELEKDAPTGRIELGALSPAQVRYFFCREHLKKVDRLAQAVERTQNAPRRIASSPKLPRAKPVKLVLRQAVSGTPRLNRLRDAIALQHDISELDAETVDVPDSPLVALFREIALLEALVARPADDEPALLVFRACQRGDCAAMFRIARSYSSCLGHIWGGAATALFEHQTEEELLLHEAFGEGHRRIQAVFLKGTNLRRLLPDPTSTILTQRADGATGIILMRVENASSENDARARAKQLSDSIDALEPESFGPVIQRMVAGKSLTDFRSGMVVHAEPSADEFRALLLSALPLPAEMQSQLTD